MSDAREVVMDTMHTHRMARAWAYGGSGLKHQETHANGIVCRCGWAQMSDESNVTGPAASAHNADEIVKALDAAGLLASPELTPTAS